MTATTDARKVANLERQVQQEWQRRIDLERRVAGLTSALRRFQVAELKRKANEAEASVNGQSGSR